MRVVGKFSSRNGLKLLKKKRAAELSEVIGAIENAKVKKDSKGLYSPTKMGRAILDSLYACGWSKPKVELELKGNFVEGDGLKHGVGLELQFGKYSFLGWDTLRKLTVFAKEGACAYGIEITPMASLRRKMSKGVGSFEQVSRKLENAGTAGPKIPLVVLGIDI